MLHSELSIGVVEEFVEECRLNEGARGNKTRLAETRRAVNMREQAQRALEPSQHSHSIWMPILTARNLHCLLVETAARMDH